MGPQLGVNIDHVATLREIRHAKMPDPVYAAIISEKAGADSIVAHLREDRRHIQEKDLWLLKKKIKVRLNLEMSTYPDIVKIACGLRPDQATLVPEKRKELTTEGGLDVVANFKKIKRVLEKLKQNGVAVSLFIDPDKKQIDAAVKLRVNRIELHTGRYADANNVYQRNRYLKQIRNAAFYAQAKGVRVFAGHGLDYHNVKEIARIGKIEELNIGYAIVCRAVVVGLKQAVKEMKALIKN
jgi:pyridoxine 5-phosphate synthase